MWYARVYRDGIRIAASSCSTGKPGLRTPTGVFTILQKDKHHKSSTSSNAPRMHHGMTVVTTGSASKAEHRTPKDFVVIDGIY